MDILMIITRHPHEPSASMSTHHRIPKSSAELIGDVDPTTPLSQLLLELFNTEEAIAGLRGQQDTQSIFMRTLYSTRMSALNKRIDAILYACVLEDPKP